MTELRHQIPIRSTPEQVYAALATAEGLRSWWTADSETDGTVNGQAAFGFGRRKTVFRMKVEALEPGKRVAWSCYGDDPEWTGTTLRWDISPDANGAMLRFAHGNWKSPNDYCAMCNTTWGSLLFRLRDYLEGRSPGPLWKE